MLWHLLLLSLVLYSFLVIKQRTQPLYKHSKIMKIKQVTKLNLGITVKLFFLLFSLLPISQMTAQEYRNSQEEYTLSKSKLLWKDAFLGVTAEVSINHIGVNLLSSKVFSQEKVVTPQIGYRVQLGLILDKQSNSPITLLVGCSKAQNRDNDTKAVLSSTALLDLGLEYPLWKLFKKQKHKMSIDLAAFASHCKVAYVNAEDVKKWGIAGRVSLSYSHKLNNGLSIGCRLYDHLGRYFGRKSDTERILFSSVNEIGLALNFSF